ncbi:uncharacterized protein BDV14DRAFT_166788 [Aspergillus stella-maris]|uniref:uncharacterized protein n=1 Tax=Aspergillus stella-maris TaxID=1810926 RepID=UPI003CCC9B8B
MTMPSEKEHPKHTIEHWKQFRCGYYEEQKRTSFEIIEALHAACAADDLPRFKELLDQWATLGFSTFDLNPITVLAIYRDNVEVVSLIYSQGDDHSEELAPFFYQEAFQ